MLWPGAMAMVLGGAVVVWPWLQGDDQAAALDSAEVPTAPPVHIVAQAGPDEEPTTPRGRAAARRGRDEKPSGADEPDEPAEPAEPVEKPVTAADEPGETAPAAKTVAIEILSPPVDAEVYRGNQRVGWTPYRGAYPPSRDQLVFVLKKAGYADQVVEIPAARDHTKVVELTRKRVRRSPPGGRRDGPRNTLRPEEGGPDGLVAIDMTSGERLFVSR